METRELNDDSVNKQTSNNLESKNEHLSMKKTGNAIKAWPHTTLQKKKYICKYLKNNEKDKNTYQSFLPSSFPVLPQQGALTDE